MACKAIFEARYHLNYLFQDNITPFSDRRTTQTTLASHSNSKIYSSDAFTPILLYKDLSSIQSPFPGFRRALLELGWCGESQLSKGAEMFK